MPSILQLAAYADLFQSLSDCVLLLDPASLVILEANEACERALDARLSKLIGRSLLNWAEADRRKDLERMFRLAMRRGGPLRFETRFRLADGRVLPLEIHAGPIGLSDGTAVLQVVARDVSWKSLCAYDEMTGVYNYRTFKNELGREHARATRFFTRYAIVFCDVDHFKEYNDRNGHLAGDRLLRQLAQVLQAVCRTNDVVARYGGEEFAVICPGVDAAGGYTLAERILRVINRTRFEFGMKQPLGKVTLSVGVAAYPEQGRTPAEVLEAADRALYQSKARGRNRVSRLEPQGLDRRAAA